MPRAHGRMDGNFDHIDRRRRTLLRRYLDRHNCLFVSKDSQVSAFILRNTEQRCIATFFSLELDAYWKMLQGSELRNLQSGVCGVDDHKSILAPLMIFQVNMPEEQRINLPESTTLEDSSCSSSGTHVMARSRNRNKKSKSFNDSSITSLPRCSEMNSSDSFSDSLATVGSDVLVCDTPIVQKAQKRSSRKKGKRKGKQYKREKVSTGLKSQCEEAMCAASVIGNSLHSVSVTLSVQISGNDLSENSRFPTLSSEDTIIEKNDSETNDAYLDSSATMMSCVSYNDELDDSESLASSTSQVLVCDNTSDLHRKSSATCHPERTSSFVDMVSANTHRKRTGNGNDNSFNSSFSTTLDHYDVDPALESFQDCWNNGISENCSNDVEPSFAIKDRCELSISRVVDSESTNSDPSFCSTVGLYVMDNGIVNDCRASDPYWSEDVLRQDTTERAECSSQACSSHDFHPVISGKRGRTGRKMTSQTGKDNTHSVWKKVQKMDTEHHVNGKKDVYAASRQVDFPSKYCNTRSRPNTSDCLKQNQKGKNGRYPCSYELINPTSRPYSSKIASIAVDSSETNSNRKPSLALKTENRYSRKGSPNGKAAPSRPSRSHAQKKDKLKNSPMVNEGILNSNSVLSSLCSNDSQLLGVEPPEKVDFSQSEQQGRNYSEEGPLSENTCSMSSEMTSAVTDSQMGLSGSAFNSLGHTPMEMQSSNYEHKNLCRDLFLMDTDSKCKNIQAECSHPEYSEPDKFGPVSQKWVPVGRKETVVSCATLTDNMKSSLIDGLVPTKVDTKSVVEEENTRVHSFVPLKRGELQCSNFSTAELNSSSSETDKSTGSLRSDPYTDGVFSGVVESNLHSSNGSDLNKIFHAINNSYNSQAMAEAVHQASGSPLAEFERFICSTSPSIWQRSHSISCRSCFPEQLRNDSCCLHQFHDVTLGSLWRWYEEPGCYGLEVKAEEKSTSKRLHNGCLEFKAYFVPYLSAVQLFVRPGFNNACFGADKATKSSEYEPRPIFTKLLSQPCNEEDACLLGSVSSVKDKLHNQSVRIDGDEELVFEYFEHAQPPQRRPLFEKIKELVSGDRPSNNQIYGDPLKLECMNLHDLHPASWFSVAWYPIYRIPEGNFRAAFLTYHSLGHFVHQSASLNTAGGSTRIVSPVVGLQSYNAKKECWFQPRVSNSKEVDAEVLSSNTSELLEERLRTLEHTASVMATAKVRKDSHRYSNNHPDYNHFFSRW